MSEATRYPPDDPREWLVRARSDLALARSAPSGVLLDDLCFHTQRAAEKAIKAVLILYDVEFPYIHELTRLLLLAEEHGASGAQKLLAAGALTRFAASGRYPGGEPPPTREVYEEALVLAEAVVVWAESMVAAPRA